MVTYFGSSEHGLDDKGRLTLPARILDQVAKAEWKFYLSASLDRCLLLHDQQGWQELVARLSRGVPGSRAHRNLCRRFLGHSEEVVPDATRRIRIPDPLLNYAGLAPSRPVVLVGMGRVSELWSPDHLGTALGDSSPEEEALFATLVEPNTSSAPGGA
jgi:division/cell wall cluster transcriptional repressor MraZ